MQTLYSSRIEDCPLDGSSVSLAGEQNSSAGKGSRSFKKTRKEFVDHDSSLAKNSKRELLMALEARHKILQKEQGMAFARALAAGYGFLHLLQLISFADYFGASRLREACCNFLGLCRKANIAGFRMKDLNFTEQKINWAFSNSACVNIMKSLETAQLCNKQIERDTFCLADLEMKEDIKVPVSVTSAANNEQNPTSNDDLINQIPENNSTDVCQGWPVPMYTDMNGSCPSFYGYHYGYRPAIQEGFTPVSDLSPSATCVYYHSMRAMNQQSSEMQRHFKAFSISDTDAFPTLKKLRIKTRHGKKSRLAAQDAESDQLCQRYGEDSTEITLLSPEVQDSSKAPMGSQDDDDDASTAPFKVGFALQETCTATNLTNRSNIAATREVDIDNEDEKRRTEDESVVPVSGLEKSSKHELQVYQSSSLHQVHEKISNEQRSWQTVSEDNSVIQFEQLREETFGSQPKKRLDFKDSGTHCILESTNKETKVVDDSFFVCSSSVNSGQKIQRSIESALQGSLICDKMSEKALKLNSGLPTRCVPEDLLMFPRQQNHSTQRNSYDSVNADVQFCSSARCTSASIHNPQRTVKDSEHPQERVKKFLLQYNEKREAKVKGDMTRLKTAEKEGRLKTIKGVLDKERPDSGRVKRSERVNLQTEAQLRAEKVRAYKAELQKRKREKEEAERQRLEELKAKRQARIAARSNLAHCTGASSSTVKQQKISHVSSHTPDMKPVNFINRLSPLPKQETSQRKPRGIAPLQQKAQHSKVFSLRNHPKDVTDQRSRSSIQSPHGKVGRASTRSQPKTEASIFNSPQRTTSPTIRNRASSGVFGRSLGSGRLPSLNQVETSEKRQKVSASNPRKQIQKTLIERKQEGRSFLRKGSGQKSYSSAFQKLKTRSPNIAAKEDTKYLVASPTQPLNLKLQQKQMVMAPRVYSTRSTSSVAIKANS
ncbi:hypothetical protein KP509_06G030300 [Ceratopteris richardii]|nr:hypothetical protein KP509_06G030300 [Ceratopteris richardii]